MSRARWRRDVLVFRPRLLLPLIEENMKKHDKAEVLFFLSSKDRVNSELQERVDCKLSGKAGSFLKKGRPKVRGDKMDQIPMLILPNHKSYRKEQETNG